MKGGTSWSQEDAEDKALKWAREHDLAKSELVISPMDEIAAAVDAVSSKRDEVDELLPGITAAEDWRRALTLIHATAKEWYSLRNRMMDAYLQLMHRDEKKETQDE